MSLLTWNGNRDHVLEDVLGLVIDCLADIDTGIGYLQIIHIQGASIDLRRLGQTAVLLIPADQDRILIIIKYIWNILR